MTYEKQISMALKQCIDSHGPITHKYISSATKRLMGNLKGVMHQYMVDNIDNHEYIVLNKKEYERLQTRSHTQVKTIHDLLAKIREYDPQFGKKDCFED